MVVYALLVGIDEYLSLSVNPLNGAGNDIDAVREYLTARVAGDLQEKVLLNANATRIAVITAFRKHFKPAGQGDTALFWYSGHGSEQPVAKEFWHLEPTGMSQTLVCADSRHGGVPDLADKELSILLDEVAARGVHVVAVLDCCHSGGGTREPFVSYRGVKRAGSAPPAEAYLPELRDTAPKEHGPVHVALSACQPFEKAKEQRIDGMVRGVFTTALLTALRTLPAGATYRELLTAAKCRVENMTCEQAPVLYPVDVGGPVDRAFLGGAITRTAPGFVMRHVRERWEVDGGRCHGIPAPAENDPVLLGAPSASGTPGKLVRVTAVRPATSLVEPIGWSPDPARQYPVIVASVPLPPAAVVLGGLPEDDHAALRLVEQAIDRAGPLGRHSRHVRVVPIDTKTTGLRLRVATVAPKAVQPVYRILRGDGNLATADVRGHTEDSARLVVARLEHIAQWTHFKDLENLGSPIAGAMGLEIVAAEPGQVRVPREGHRLLPDAKGDIRLTYRLGRSGWEPPTIFIRLRNNTARQLWCALLDLTDQFRVHPRLLPGTWVGAGEVAVAYDGKRIPVTLPRGREVRPGARVQDWIKLIVSEEPFSSLAFELSRLNEPSARGAGQVRPRGIVDRLGLRVRTRDVGEERLDLAQTADWATSIISIITEVPAV